MSSASTFPPAPRRRRARFWVGLASAAVLLAALVLFSLVSAVPLSSGILREKIVATLSEQFEGDVGLAEVRIKAFPRFSAELAGLTIRHRNRVDVPPLIVIDKVTVDADLLTLWRRHVSRVTLEGLAISIAPKAGAGQGAPPAPPTFDARDIVIDRLVTRDARLSIIPREPDKSPKVWAIHDLDMRSVSIGRAMPFEATLTNAIPPGEIATKGSFGPWNAEDPGDTPLEGTFRFDDADLSVFKGISGILSAHGEFGGSLERIGVHGETDTPQFTVAVGGHPVPLHADYHATVDGTNGDTLLDRIDASFLNTSLVAKGGVVDTPGRDGRTVTLDITMNRARLEDVLRLAIKAQPPMVGALTLKTRFVLPPGERDVVDKLRLAGEFVIAKGRFISPDVQTKIEELSRRSRGPKDGTQGERPDKAVTSNFGGRFKLGGGTLGLDALSFDTAGARVQLAGTYGLRSEQLAFKGTLQMDATISQTQRGWKRWILKPFDEVFERKSGGGTELPIKIEGSRASPAFGLDARRLLHRGG